jgi:hypothetical protein
MSEIYEIRKVKFGEDAYMKLLAEGFEVVDKADDRGQERVLRKLIPSPPAEFAFAKLS